MSMSQTLSIPDDDHDEYLRYPETSLFDFDPLPLNLIPPREIEDLFNDKERFMKYRTESLSSGGRYAKLIAPPIHAFHSTDPDKDSVFPAYKEPGPLPGIDGSGIKFLDILSLNHYGENSGSDVFLIELNDKQWVLKTVSFFRHDA